jgi:thioesterase domain-containing protein
MKSTDIENLLKSKIPISDFMKIQINKLSEGELELKIPLPPNKNHKNTMFGGSIYSGCALASYGLFLAELSIAGFNTNNIVISDGNILYKKPITKDALIKACWPSATEKVRFFQQLQQKKKSRVNLTCTVFCENQLSAEFTGTFVAQL